MKKKALRKDFYMEIRRSIGRFLSIFFIVAIGCAFYSGIRSSEPDMRYSGDAYFDKKNLMDIQIISTLGLTDGDLQAIEDVDGIKKAEGGYSVDVLCTEGENKIAVHVMSMLPTMNEVQLEKGRLPEKENECAVDVDYLEEGKLKIGDSITFSSGSEDEITETLMTDTFTIVGAVSSPCYISFQRGSTTIGNGSVAAFIVVPEESFLLDVYTEIYAQAEGAKELTAFTDAYDDCVADVLERVEEIKEERQAARYNEIMEEAQSELEDAEQELADARQELEDGKAEAQAELADARRQLEDAQAEVDRGKEQIQSSRKQMEDSRRQLTEAQAELEKGQEELNANIDTLNAQIDQLNEAKEQYNALAASGKTDDVTVATMQALYEEIQKGETAVSQAKSQIEAARGELKSAQAEIDSGWAQIESGQRELADAEAELADAETEIEDGWEEYYEGEKEAEAEIADGEQQIADAQQELDDAREELQELEEPQWYVYDRSNLPDYSGYGENADRMRAIGEVFPAIFFLVAALISLTTMTRMVEEQRTQIGTFKALGYERHSIAGKYLGYALFATVTGSLLGVLFGEKVFPYIIINAYGIMFQHMHDIRLPYNLLYGVGAAAAALVSTLLATVLACYRELREQAAELMRPPAPKQGQRVLLERAGFIWRRLNFSWKASVRNLVRYKKRLFMTIFGIGGCMALMLVGFGLKDSIFAIVDIQYGEIQLYDGNIILEDDTTKEERDNITAGLEKDSGLAGLTEGRLSQISVGAGKDWYDVYLCIPSDVEGFSDFVSLKDRKTDEIYSLDNSGAVLTEKMASELDVRAGDVLTIRDEDRGDLKVKISAVCENYLGHYLYMTPEFYEKTYGEQPQYNSFFYKTADRTTQEAERIGEEALTFPGTLSISYTTDMREQVDNMLGSLDLVIVVLIISAGMLAFVVLYNLNNINITERQRELATLKVLGFYNNEVSMYVYRENIMLTFFGAVFGIILGKILHRFIIVTVEVESVMFGRNIDLSSFVYGFLLTFVFSLLVNGAMYFKLKKINMVESLKSVE